MIVHWSNSWKLEILILCELVEICHHFRYEFYRSGFSDADLVSTKVDESYGIHDGGPVPDIQTQNHIEVPRGSIN